MSFLNDGETIRQRLESLLGQMAHTSDAKLHTMFAEQANVYAQLLAIDEAATQASVAFGSVETLQAQVGYFFSEEDVREALAGGGYGEADVLIERLRRVVETNLDADPLPVYELKGDPRLEDTISLDVQGDEPTPALPTEQLPASDPNPNADFDFETDAREAAQPLRDMIAEVADDLEAEDPGAFDPAAGILPDGTSIYDAEADEVDVAEDFAEVDPGPKKTTSGLKKLAAEKKGRSSK